MTEIFCWVFDDGGNITVYIDKLWLVIYPNIYEVYDETYPLLHKAPISSGNLHAA